MTPNTSRRCLGLVGGLGPAATAHYYTRIVSVLAEQRTSPRLVMSHADSGFVLDRIGAQDEEGLAAYLLGHIEALARAGADLAVIPAVAPHFCAPVLERKSPVPLIDIIGAVGAELRARGLSRIGVMGTRWVMSSRFYGRLKDIDVVPLHDDEVDAVHTIYTGIVSSGGIAARNVERLRTIARGAIARDGLNAIALAGTDLIAAFDEKTAGFAAVDCARVHIDAIVDAMLK